MEDKNKKENYEIDYDNLAMPEIHTGQVEPKPEKKKEEDISYESLAMPEIHVHKKHSDK